MLKIAFPRFARDLQATCKKLQASPQNQGRFRNDVETGVVGVDEKK